MSWIAVSSSIPHQPLFRFVVPLGLKLPRFFAEVFERCAGIDRVDENGNVEKVGKIDQGLKPARREIPWVRKHKERLRELVADLKVIGKHLHARGSDDSFDVAELRLWAFLVLFRGHRMFFRHSELCEESWIDSFGFLARLEMTKASFMVFAAQ